MGAYTFALLSAPVPHNIKYEFLACPDIWCAGCHHYRCTIKGLPILNLRGDYLAIVTLGFGEIIRNLIRSDLLKRITLGPRGVRHIAEPTFFGKTFSTDVDYMYFHCLGIIINFPCQP